MLILWFNIFLCLVLAVWFVKKQYSKPYFWLIVASFLCKVLATIAFVHLHQNLYPQYTPDYQLIFADSCKLSNFFSQSILNYFKILYSAPLDTESWYLASQPRAFFAVKLYSLLVWLTGQHFWLSMLYASLAVLAALWWLARTLMRFFPHTRSAVLLSFIFLPSLAFWASATTKESLLMIFLAVLSVIFLKAIYQRVVWWQAIIFLILAYWLLLLKYYYAFGFFFAVCLYLFMSFIGRLKAGQKIALLFGFVLTLFCLTFLHHNLRVEHFVNALYRNYRLILAVSPQGSAIDLGLQATWQSIVFNSPQGLWIGLFAPLPYQISKWQVLPIAIENLAILLLGLYVLFFTIRCKILDLKSKKWKLRNVTPLGSERKAMICLFLFVLIMATFLGLSSPNFGALSRYRIGFSPFLVYALLVVFQYLKRQAP